MLLTRLFPALFFGPALADVNLTDLIIRIPACTQKCALSQLSVAHCSLTKIPECLCPNVTMQRQLGTCILKTCNLTEQIVSSTIFQDELCKGIPYPSRSSEIIRIAIVTTVIAYFSVILRCISRYQIANRFWWDDWTAILAAAFMVPLSVFAILYPYYGFGRHFWNVPPLEIITLRKLYYVVQILYVIIQSLAKMSVLFLYLRIFRSGAFCLFVKICMAWITLHFISFLMAVVLQCIPISALWNTDIHGKCVNSQAMVYAGAAASILEDLVIIVIPLSELKGLHMDMKKKVMLGFMFALGSFACVTSMIRLKYIIKYGASDDATWDQVDVIVWSLIEVYTAVICACLVCIRPLVNKCIPSFLTKKPSVPRIRESTKPSWRASFRQGGRSGLPGNGIKLSSQDEAVVGDREKGISPQTERKSGINPIELHDIHASV